MPIIFKTIFKKTFKIKFNLILNLILKIILVLILLPINNSLANCNILTVDEINFGDVSIIDSENKYIDVITKANIKIQCNNQTKTFFCLTIDDDDKLSNNYNNIAFDLYKDATLNQKFTNNNYNAYADTISKNNIYNLVIYAKAKIATNISSGLYTKLLSSNNINFKYKDALLVTDKHPGCTNLLHSNNDLKFNLNIKANIVAQCLISSVSDLNFGNITNIDYAVNASANINVKCTDENVKFKLNIGSGNYFNNNVRRMFNKKYNSYINYYIYRDVNYTLIWDYNNFYDFIGNSNIKVFGKITKQNKVPIGNYQDTLKILIQY